MFLSQFWVQKLGWTLLHFLWQGTAIAVAYAVLRRLLARSLSAQGRYMLACSALVAMAAAPLLTFFLIPTARGAGTWTISAAESQRLLPAVVALWLLGVLAFSIRLLGGWRFTSHLRSCSHPAPADWQQTLERIAARVGTKRQVRLLISSLVDVPTVIGWLRPVILVPVEFLTGLSVEHITALLAHEIAHIRRHDYLASILQSIAEAVLFYHPAVWWISVQIRAERELCCDDLAVAVSGDALAYAQALAELESRQPSQVAPVLAANGGLLVNRIRRLIEPANAIADSLPGPAAAWTMILLWAAGVGVATIHGAQTPVIKPPVVNRINDNLNPVPESLPPLPSPFPALAGKARNTLLYDPVFSAQLAQPQPQSDAPVDDKLQLPWRNWLNEDVVYIITDAERRAFRQLITDEEREQFIEQFWLRRDPTPGTVENEFKEEIYRRIAYANEHFSSRVPGWKTDRGRIYITFGPPDEIDSHPSGGTYQRPAAEGGGQTTTLPFEDWRYRFIDGIGNNVNLEFVDSDSSGELKLAMDPYEKDAARSRAAIERISQLAQLQQPPDVKFKELDDAIDKRTTYGFLPMQVRIDYVRVTESSVMANITIQFENRDLQFQLRDGVQKSVVNLLGRISTMTRRPVTTFERPLEIDAPPDMLQKYVQQRSIYQQSVPLQPGQYRLNIVVRDTVSGIMNNYEVALDVPSFDEGKLASSSLILADTIEKLPARSFGGAMFAIGGTKVRPRLGLKFTSNEKIGIYLQLYNFSPDPTTQKPSGAIEYEIDKVGSSEKVMDFSEEIGSIANASASQVTIEKLLPLNTLAFGTYTLKVKATDRNRSQSIQQQGSFTVGPE
jgi:GWxTD domain-containing protein